MGNTTQRMVERLAYMVIGAAFLVVGFLLVVLGLTFLPVIGLLAGIPVMALSLHFLSPRMEVSAVDEAEAADTMEGEFLCTWPQTR